MIALIALIFYAGAEPSLLIQEKNFWHVLAEVSFRKENKNGYEIEVPMFSTHLKSWNGKNKTERLCYSGGRSGR